MKCRPILVDDSLRELTHHGTRDFPLSMDRQAVADPSHGNVRHWHPEIQEAELALPEYVNYMRRYAKERLHEQA